MKKFISTLLLNTFAILLLAQVQVPRQVNQAFKDAHPNHDFITWTMEGANYKAASVDLQQLHYITVYDANGNLIRTESEVVAKDVPSAIKGYFNDNFPSDKDYSVWVVQDKDGNRTYYSTHNDVRVTFDKSGNITKN